MCQRCAELEERVAWLESELGLQRDDDLMGRLLAVRPSRSAGGSPQVARFVAALYQAQGKPLSHHLLMEACPPVTQGEDDRYGGIVTVWALRARRWLGADAIQTLHGRGYRLTDAGTAAVRAILSPDDGRAAA